MIEPSDKLKKELEAVLYWIGDAQEKTHDLHYAGSVVAGLLRKAAETGDVSSTTAKAEILKALEAWDAACKALD